MQWLRQYRQEICTKIQLIWLRIIRYSGVEFNQTVIYTLIQNSVKRFFNFL